VIDELTTIRICDPFPDLMQDIDLIFDVVERRFVGQILEKVADFLFRRGHGVVILPAGFGTKMGPPEQTTRASRPGDSLELPVLLFIQV
jgi:hypothetical protein